MNVGTLFAALKLDSKGFEKSLENAGLRLGRFNKVVALAGAAIAVGLVAGLGKAVGAAIDFDAAMTKSTAIMVGLSQEMRAEMETAAREVAKATTFSATEAADSYFYLASAGLDAEASMAALPRVAKFAQAGNFDMALATDLLTDAQSALGLTIRDDVVANMEQMNRVSDVLVKANVLANATVQQFSESLTNRAGAALKTLNKDVEEGVAVLAAFADQGVKGQVAGQALFMVLRDLQTANMKNTEAWEEHNLAAYDADGNMRNMADIVADLEGLLDGMTNAQVKSTLAQLGFTDRSQGYILTLLGTSDAIRRYEGELRSAAGYTDEVANNQLQSVQAQLALLGSAFEDVMISVGQKLLPALVAVVGFTRDVLIPAFSAVIDVIAFLLTPIALLIEHFDTLKPGLIAIGVVIAGALIPALIGLAAAAVPAGIAMVLAFAPVVLTVAAVTAAVVGLSAAVNYFAMDFGDMGDRIHAVADQAGKEFNDVKEWIRAHMEETGASFEQAADAADEHFGTMTKSAEQLVIESGAQWEEYQRQIGGVGDATAEAAEDTEGSLADMGIDVDAFAEQTGIDLAEVDESLDGLEGDFGDMADNIDEETDEAFDHVQSFLDQTIRKIQEAEDPVREAGDAAASAWLDPIKTASEIASLEAELGSDELREGLASEDEGIRLDAELRTNEIIAELMRLKNEQATQGDEMAQLARTQSLLTSDFMKDGLNSEDEEIRAIFRGWRHELATRVEEMEETAANAHISQELANAIEAHIPSLQAAAERAAAAVRQTFPMSEPKNPRSPFRGITKGWGLGAQLEKGIRVSLRGIDLSAPVMERLGQIGFQGLRQPEPAVSTFGAAMASMESRDRGGWGDGRVTVRVEDPDGAIRGGGYDQGMIEKMLEKGLRESFEGASHRAIRMGAK